MQNNDVLLPINRLIFVQEYEKALQLLNAECLHGSEDILVHIRRIELYSKLDDLQTLKGKYQEETPFSQLCLLFCELMSEEAIFKNIFKSFQKLLRFGENQAAIYYGMAICYERNEDWQQAAAYYNQCLSCDPHWFLAEHGLSQVYLQSGERETAERYFQVFEESAPLYIYGCFATHKEVFGFFMSEKDYGSALKSLELLEDWWVDNKGVFPQEYKLYSILAQQKVATLVENLEIVEQSQSQLDYLLQQISEESDVDSSTLFFMTSTLEEFDQFSYATRLYQQTIEQTGKDANVALKVARDLMTQAEYSLSIELLHKARRIHPNHPELASTLLIAQLQQERVPVQEYLMDKQKLSEMVHRVQHAEFLKVLYRLAHLASFDCDIHEMLGSLNARIGNFEKAAECYEKMYALDFGSIQATLKLAGFYLEKDTQKCLSLLIEKESEFTSKQHMIQLNWLRARAHIFLNKPDTALSHFQFLLQQEPWNPAYILGWIVSKGVFPKEQQEKFVEIIMSDDDMTALEEVRWQSIFKHIESLTSENKLQQAYLLAKLQYLLSHGDVRLLKPIIDLAKKMDPLKGIEDLVLLVNTNFNHILVYWGIGHLYKDMWQLETAKSWFVLANNQEAGSEDIRSLILYDIGDSLTWLNHDLEKAESYLQASLDLRLSDETLLAMSHNCLRRGQVQQAQDFLEQAKKQIDPVLIHYLRGLIEYRNGKVELAKEYWKPIIPTPCEGMKAKFIKDQVFNFYFNGSSYLEVS